MKINKTKIIALIAIICIIILAIVIGIVIANSSKSNSGEVSSLPEQENNVDKVQVNIANENNKINVVDINSKSRPYAMVVNNTPVAVKVQEGLNKAYLVYEIPTEGYTSRLLALYKDVEEDLVVGTIRSARHNFVDFALESDAIFCCYGWSHYAEDDIKAGSIDYFQGLFGGPFYRNNPESLAVEHTAYTSMNKIKQAVSEKGFRTTTDNSILLNYNSEDVTLSETASPQTANTVTIPYGAATQTETFKYDKNTKMYTRYADGKECKDHKTQESVTTKNIIVQKINYEMCDDNYYWNLHTTGSGEGYYITNGYAVPITWSKSSRSSKTKYTYKQGTKIDGKDVGGKEIEVNDGRTWIAVQTNKQKLTIE